MAGAKIYNALSPLYLHGHARRLCQEHRDCFCTNWKSHVGEKHNCCSGSGSLGESRSLMAEVNREQQSDPCKTRSLQKHRLLGLRVKRDCEMKLPLFSTLSLPLSICPSLPFSLSLCLFSLSKPSAANFHPTHLRTDSNTSLSLCQDILLANLPHPLAMCAFYSTDCLPDNSPMC